MLCPQCGHKVGPSDECCQECGRMVEWFGDPEPEQQATPASARSAVPTVAPAIAPEPCDQWARRTRPIRTAAHIAQNYSGALGVFCILVPGLAFAGAVLSGEVAIVLGAAAFLALGLVAAAQWLLQAWLCGQLALVVEMLADTADRVTTLSDVGRTDVQ